MLREDDLELAAGYALGTLGEQDRMEVEQRLASGQAELARAVEEFRDAAALLAHATPASAPPSGLRQRVLEAARTEMGVGATAAPPATPAPAPPRSAPARPARPAPPPAGLGSWGIALIAVTTAFAILSAVLLVQNQGLRRRADGLDDQMHKLEADLVQLNESNRWGEVWRARNVRVVSFGAMGTGQASLAGRVAYDPVSRRAVVTLDHIRRPPARDLELWAIKEGRPVSLGVIHPDGAGNAEIRLEEVGNASELGAFTVSLEAEGGSGNPNAPAGPTVTIARLPG